MLADVKTLEANGVYGMAVVTALTWQNDTEFDKVEWVDADRIISQVAVLLRRFAIRYFKIGLIENVATLTKVVDYLEEAVQEPVIVFDPILRASAGYSFHSGNALAGLLSRFYCVTPNIPEAQQLLGDTDVAALLPGYAGHTHIYLKGGHSDEATATDVLYTREGSYAFAQPRLANGAKHGSGCVLSSALTAQLALGHDVVTAAKRANAYTHRYLGSSDTLLGHHQHTET